MSIFSFLLKGTSPSSPKKSFLFLSGKVCPNFFFSPKFATLVHFFFTCFLIKALERVETRTKKKVSTTTTWVISSFFLKGEGEERLFSLKYISQTFILRYLIHPTSTSRFTLLFSGIDATKFPWCGNNNNNNNKKHPYRPSRMRESCVRFFFFLLLRQWHTSIRKNPNIVVIVITERFAILVFHEYRRCILRRN